MPYTITKQCNGLTIWDMRTNRTKVQSLVLIYNFHFVLIISTLPTNPLAGLKVCIRPVAHGDQVRASRCIRWTNPPKSWYFWTFWVLVASYIDFQLFMFIASLNTWFLLCLCSLCRCVPHSLCENICTEFLLRFQRPNEPEDSLHAVRRRTHSCGKVSGQEIVLSTSV